MTKINLADHSNGVAPASRRAISRPFLRDDRGAVALIFGLMLLPLLGAIGLAIDFGNVMTARTKAQMAADAAALQATGVARDLMKDGDGSTTSTNSAIADAKTRAAALFNAHAQQSNLKTWTVAVTVTRTGQSLTAKVDYSVTSQNAFGKIFGQPQFKATGSATSAASLPSYSDVYLALDVSGSMGIASNNDEMIKLFQAKGKRTDGTKLQTSCVFGCHTVETDKGWSESFSSVASRLNIRLRIDVLRDAVLDMITTAESDADAAPIYRLGIYTLGATADASTWALNQLSGLTNNFNSLRAVAKTIDIATPPLTAPQKQNTYINEQLAYAAPMLPQSYDGSSQAKSKKYIFIITDGARDVPSSFGSCTAIDDRCVNSINSSVCKSFKDKGITVAVLYTTYIPVLSDPAIASSGLEYWYKRQMVDTGAYAKIAPALKDCASPGWFFEASDDEAITKAMADMFAQTTAAPSLVN